MTFSGGFGKAFRPVFDPGLTAVPWYRAGGASLPVAAYQPKGAASLAASYVNLANPGTYNAVKRINDPTWNVGAGWGFSSSNTDLAINITPPASATWSFVCRFSNYVSGVLYGQKNYPATNRHSITPASVSYHNGSTTASSVGPAMSTGVLAIAGTSAYRNGVDEGVTLSNGSGTPVKITIGILNDIALGGSLFLTANIQAFAIWNTSLTALQVAAVSAAMAAL